MNNKEVRTHSRNVMKQAQTRAHTYSKFSKSVLLVFSFSKNSKTSLKRLASFALEMTSKLFLGILQYLMQHRINSGEKT
jgi:hypothetical protein